MFDVSETLYSLLCLYLGTGLRSFFMKDSSKYVGSILLNFDVSEALYSLILPSAQIWCLSCWIHQNMLVRFYLVWLLSEMYCIYLGFKEKWGLKTGFNISFEHHAMGCNNGDFIKYFYTLWELVEQGINVWVWFMCKAYQSEKAVIIIQLLPIHNNSIHALIHSFQIL